MWQNAKHLLFGLMVLTCYWFVVRNGIVFWSFDQAPSGVVSSHTGTGGRSHPTFWSTGFQGGK